MHPYLLLEGNYGMKVGVRYCYKCLYTYERMLGIGRTAQLTVVSVNISAGMLVLSSGVDAIWYIEAKRQSREPQCNTFRRNVIAIRVIFRRGILTRMSMASFFLPLVLGGCAAPLKSMSSAAIQPT
jgi:hypothetical protein